jgi:hypothetical protein
MGAAPKATSSRTCRQGNPSPFAESLWSEHDGAVSFDLISRLRSCLPLVAKQTACKRERSRQRWKPLRAPLNESCDFRYRGRSPRGDEYRARHRKTRGSPRKLRLSMDQKSSAARTEPLLSSILEQRHAQSDAAQHVDKRIIPYVFHDVVGAPLLGSDQRPKKSFRRAWRRACLNVGFARRIPYDFRRTAVRKSGVRAGG